MSKSLIIALLFAAAGFVGLIWNLNGGARDGAPYLMYGGFGLCLAVGVLSRVLGGAWFTDNAGKH